MAFGLDRSELHTRLGLAEGVTFPRVLGIEATGVVDRDPSGTLAPGEQVMTMMGGMGRVFDGGYAQYTCVPAAQVRVRISHGRSRRPARPDPSRPRRHVVGRVGYRCVGEATRADGAGDHASRHAGGGTGPRRRLLHRDAQQRVDRQGLLPDRLPPERCPAHGVRRRPTRTSAAVLPRRRRRGARRHPDRPGLRARRDPRSARIDGVRGCTRQARRPALARRTE